MSAVPVSSPLWIPGIQDGSEYSDLILGKPLIGGDHSVTSGLFGSGYQNHAVSQSANDAGVGHLQHGWGVDQDHIVLFAEY